MAPSMSLFSRRKNSTPESRSAVKSPDLDRPAAAVVSPASDLFPASPRLHKPRSRDTSNPLPSSPKRLPRIRTTSVSPPESAAGPRLSRSSSDTSMHCAPRGDHQRHGSVGMPVYTAHPPPPPPGRYIHQPSPVRTQRYQISSELPTAPPTPASAGVTPTSAAEAARKRPFRFPVSALSISPPLSPESPMVNGYSPMDSGPAGNSLGMSPIFPSASHAATPNMDASDAPHDALLQRIRELEAKNRELEADTTAHGTRITALRQSHLAVVESLKEAHAVELSTLRNSTHWPMVVEGKEKELELLRSNSDTLVARLTLLEQLLKERDQQVEWMRERLRTERKPEATVESSAKENLESLLAEERRQREQILQKSKEDMAFVVQEEEKRRAELNWLFGEKIENVEALRRSERQELESQLETLRREKEAAEQRAQDLAEKLSLGSPMPQTGTDELMAMVKTLNTRLAEGKKKNKALEATMAQITEEAWFNVSDSKHSIQKLKNELEDKDAALAHLEREHAIAKKERAEYEDAWKRVCAENSLLQESVEDRDERIRDLEEESSALRSELEQQQQQNDVHEDILVKLVESSSSRETSRSPTNEDTADLQELIEKLRRDIKLYRSDIRAYKRDVKTRDRAITELQSQLSSPTEKSLLQGFPAPPRENEALPALVKQQAKALMELEEKVARLTLENEDLTRNGNALCQPIMYTAYTATAGHDRYRSVSGRERERSGNGSGEPPNSPRPPPPPPKREESGDVFVW